MEKLQSTVEKYFKAELRQYALPGERRDFSVAFAEGLRDAALAETFGRFIDHLAMVPSVVGVAVLADLQKEGKARCGLDAVIFQKGKIDRAGLVGLSSNLEEINDQFDAADRDLVIALLFCRVDADLEAAVVDYVTRVSTGTMEPWANTRETTKPPSWFIFAEIKH